VTSLFRPFVFVLVCFLPAQTIWRADQASTLERRFSPPPGFQRTPAAPGSFAQWLRRLPLKPGNPPVMLYNGRQKARQVHAAVVDMSVGTKDLLQCADALMRLRAEYLYGSGKTGAIAFHTTSGDLIPFSRWMKGERPVLTGGQISWRPGAPDGSYLSFSRYLEFIYTYSGTVSIKQDTRPVAFSEMVPGDLFLQSGSPGHAVMVADTAEKNGERLFLLVQSYMPAQEIHVLKSDQGAWYRARLVGTELVTPEWTFPRESLRRFLR